MPHRNRGRLLAGMVALVGLCTAGPGCQSQSVRPSAVAPAPGQVRAAPRSDGNGVGQSVQVTRPTVGVPGSGQGVVVVSAFHGADHVGANSGGQDGAPTGGYVVRTLTPLSRASGEELPDAPPPPPPHAASAQLMPAPLLPAVPHHPEPPHPVVTASHVVHGGPEAGVAGVPREFEKQSLPVYVVEPPDILLIRATPSVLEPVGSPLDGQHLVRPDGSISLGVYGDVWVAGRTLQEVRDIVADKIHAFTKSELTVESVRKGIFVDVLAYNSKVYYVITDGAGYGEQVYSIPVKGNETVLDALATINGLPAVSSKKRIWIARATPSHSDHPLILPVDWCAITQYGSAGTNYQIFPGDRIYVAADKLLTLDSALAKILNPIDRLFGSVLLGSSTVNSIRNGGTGSGTGGGVP